MKFTEFPEIGEFVVCTVKDVRDFGAIVTLEEYQDKEGFIHIAEIARGWIRYIKDHVKEGQKIVCKVIRVDHTKGHVDLSLKHVNEHQKQEKIQEWKNEQKSEQLLKIVGKRIGKSLESCYKEFGMSIIQKCASLYGGFEEAAKQGVDGFEKLGFKGTWVKSFVDVAKENISLPSVEISGILELTCPLADGVKYVKEALISAETLYSNLQYVGAPKYRITVKAPDYRTAEKELKKAVEKAIKYIEAHEGSGVFTRK